MENLLNFITDSFSAIINFINFIASLPNLIVTMFLTFPAFIRIGFEVIFSMLLIALTVRIYRYVKG